MSFAAYQRVAQVTETPRQLEYRLLGEVCRELSEVERDGSDRRRTLEALDWNRRVWMTFSVDCAKPENALPVELRSRIISLGMWVYRYTEDAMWKEAAIQPLIDVNAAMIKGLIGNTQAAA